MFAVKVFLVKSFLSTPSARRATIGNIYNGFVAIFLSTPSARRATTLAQSMLPCHRISIHALREEGDPPVEPKQLIHFYFYPRPPRGGRPKPVDCKKEDIPISIHALREEGDCCPIAAINPIDDFYPRPPRGGRPRFLLVLPSLSPFLSTPSARRATLPTRAGRLTPKFLSTPSARRATVIYHFQHPCLVLISIHALREEGDHSQDSSCSSVVGISIHALREEGDLLKTLHPDVYAISIHALREEGDLLKTLHPDVYAISIHALREEGDPPSRRPVQILWIFLSTPSARRATR